jgi:hypothetical protein
MASRTAVRPTRSDLTRAGRRLLDDRPDPSGRVGDVRLQPSVSVNTYPKAHRAVYQQTPRASLEKLAQLEVA